MGMKKTTRTQLRTIRRRRLALALVGAMAMPLLPAMAQNIPNSGTVVNGSATIGQVGNQMTVTQTTKGAIINWGSFNIGADYSVKFDQQFGNTSVTLNRVTGIGASNINGSLTANGSVFLINPAGIAFGSGAQVNVGSLVASVLDITDEDFDRGIERGVYKFSGVSSSGSIIQNAGSITTQSGGDAIFIGNFENSDGYYDYDVDTDTYAWVSTPGRIETSQGSVIVAAAPEVTVTIDLHGDGLTQVELSGDAAGFSHLWNTGTIVADGGQIIMRTLAGDIVNSGTLQARSVQGRSGRVELVAEHGDIWIFGGFDEYIGETYVGVIDVTGGVNDKGGTVVLEGSTVSLDNFSFEEYPEFGRIDASGGAGGGTIEITATGEWSYAGDPTVHFGEGTSITANGLHSSEGGIGEGGDGGTITIKGDGILTEAAITALDGEHFIETRTDNPDGTVSIDVQFSGDEYQGGVIEVAPFHDSYLGNEFAFTNSGDIQADEVVVSNFNVFSWNSSDSDLLNNVSFCSELVGGFICNDGGITATDSMELTGFVFNSGDLTVGREWFFEDSQNYGWWESIAGRLLIGDQNFPGRFASSFWNTGAISAGRVESFGYSFANSGRISSAVSIINAIDSIWVADSSRISGYFSDIATAGGLYVAENATFNGSVTFRAPSFSIVNSGDGTSALAYLTDGAISRMLQTASVSVVSMGDIDIANGVSISHVGVRDAYLLLSARNSIIASGEFDISSSAGELNITFRAGDEISLACSHESYCGALSSNGGDIVFEGGDVSLETTSLTSFGGDVRIEGRNIRIAASDFLGGYYIGSPSVVSSGDGEISIIGTEGVRISNSWISSTGGNIRIEGTSANGSGIEVRNFRGVDNSGSASSITTTSGDITLISTGQVGLNASAIPFSTQAGNITLTGTATGTGPGVYIGSGGLTANGGDITITGHSADGAGVTLAAGSAINAVAGLVTITAGNDGESDAIDLQGSIASTTGVVLKPYDISNAITLGAGNGFSLTVTELSRINTPQLVIGSSLHAGAIRVLDNIDYQGNLTLQNQGVSSGGISIEAALGVGDHTLALASGGNIAQTAAGVVTARSLLALAGGSVVLGQASNHVSGNTLAGSAAGDFGFQNIDPLTIGTVGAFGFDATANALQSMSAAGISASGDVRVQNVTGTLTLLADISGRNIDLLTGSTLQNTGQASLNASGHWRVWADDWVGEVRGGLNGNGALPNLYDCTADGVCGTMAWAASATDNHFIYRAQPVATISFADATREYGLANPALAWTLSGGELGDTLAAIVGTGGLASTDATIGTDVGRYMITGTGWVSPAGYRLDFNPGWLAITPATLLFTATPTWRYWGDPLVPFEGTVAGLRNGDTLEGIFPGGFSWSTNATSASMPGFYAIQAGGNLQNYVIRQAPQNQAALQIIPKPSIPPPPPPPPPPFSAAQVCAVDAGDGGAANGSFTGGDDLGRQWLLVRDGLQLNSCLDSNGKSSCKID